MKGSYWPVADGGVPTFRWYFGELTFNDLYLSSTMGPRKRSEGKSAEGSASEK